MEVIRDRNGRVTNRSRNMRGIRAYCSRHIAEYVRIDRLPCGGGRLVIQFDGGAQFVNVWADFDCLRDYLSRWRNLYGAPLIRSGIHCNAVGFRNPALR